MVPNELLPGKSYGMTTVSLTLLLILKAVLLISAQKYYFSADKAVQNLIYDAASKRIFVGGTNKIFRLTVSCSDEFYYVFKTTELEIKYHCK